MAYVNYKCQFPGHYSYFRKDFQMQLVVKAVIISSSHRVQVQIYSNNKAII